MCCILTGGVFADTNWNMESGLWSDGANWTNGVPDGTNGNINLRFSNTSVCTLNTDEGLFTNYMYLSNGQTLNIEDGGYLGTTRNRWGDGSAAYVNMSGNATFIINSTDGSGGYATLWLGGESSAGSGVLTMSGTSKITTYDPLNAGELHVGGKGATGKLVLIGSNVSVDAEMFHLTSWSAGNATLEYVMDAGGASTIACNRLELKAGSGAVTHLVLSAAADLPEEDIVLITSNQFYGNKVFDTVTVEGVPQPSAAEGALLIVGGNMYELTYNYGGSAGNIALTFVQTAAHLATVPNPVNGATLSASPATLSWANPDPNDGAGDVICTVYFGTEPPADPNRTNMDAVTLAANASSVEINAANFPTCGAQPIADESDFYWVVDCVDTSLADPSLGKSPVVWSFSTYYNHLPVVDAGPDQILYGDGANYPAVNLAGSAADDGLPDPPAALTIEWTLAAGPAGAVIHSPNTASTAVTVTESGVYTFELSADDGTGPVSDAVQVIVGIDSCEASYLNGSNYSTKDLDRDCDVDINDLAAFMSTWMKCTNNLEGC